MREALRDILPTSFACLVLLRAFISTLRSADFPFGRYLQTFFDGSVARVLWRSRGVLPLPPITPGYLAVGSGMQGAHQ